MSPEECAAVEDRVYVIPRDCGNGRAELFVQVGRDSMVAQLSPAAIIGLAEFCDAWRARVMRRALLEKADGGS